MFPVVQAPLLISVEPLAIVTLGTPVILRGQNLEDLAKVRFESDPGLPGVDLNITGESTSTEVSAPFPDELFDKTVPRTIMVSVINIYGMTSNRLSITAGFGLQLNLSTKVVGFYGQPLVLRFESSLSLEQLHLPVCIV